MADEGFIEDDNDVVRRQTWNREPYLPITPSPAGSGPGMFPVIRAGVSQVSPQIAPIPMALFQASPTSVSPIIFNVLFGEAVFGFTSASVVIGGTALPTTVVVSDVLTGIVSTGLNGAANYKVEVSGMTVGGLVTLSIHYGAARNGAGVLSQAAFIEVDTVQFLPPIVPIGPIWALEPIGLIGPLGPLGPLWVFTVLTISVSPTGFDYSSVFSGFTICMIPPLSYINNFPPPRILVSVPSPLYGETISIPYPRQGVVFTTRLYVEVGTYVGIIPGNVGLMWGLRVFDGIQFQTLDIVILSMSLGPYQLPIP